jgi:hypothetical protein
MRKGHVWLTKLRVETQPLIEPVEIKAPDHSLNRASVC